MGFCCNLPKVLYNKAKKSDVDMFPNYASGRSSGQRLTNNTQDSRIYRLVEGDYGLNGAALFLVDALQYYQNTNQDWCEQVLEKVHSFLERDDLEKIPTNAALLAKLTSLSAKDIPPFLSPILRRIIVRSIREDLPHYEEHYWMRLKAMVQYVLKTYDNSRDAPDADSFLVHPFIVKEVDQLLKNIPNVYEKHFEDLRNWWKPDGFSMYLNIIEQPAQGTSDITQWMGSIELDILGKTLKFIISIQKGEKVFNIGEEIDAPVNLSMETINILDAMGYLRHGDSKGIKLSPGYLYDLTFYRHRLPEYIRTEFLSCIRNASQHLHYNDLKQLLNWSAVQFNECEFWLMRRGILNNDVLWRDGELFDVNRIEKALGVISEDDWYLLENAHKQRDQHPLCSLSLKGKDWYYIQTHNTASKLWEDSELVQTPYIDDNTVIDNWFEANKPFKKEKSVIIGIIELLRNFRDFNLDDCLYLLSKSKTKMSNIYDVFLEYFSIEFLFLPNKNCMNDCKTILKNPEKMLKLIGGLKNYGLFDNKYENANNFSFIRDNLASSKYLLLTLKILRDLGHLTQKNFELIMQEMKSIESALRRKNNSSQSHSERSFEDDVILTEQDLEANNTQEWFVDLKNYVQKFLISINDSSKNEPIEGGEESSRTLVEQEKTQNNDEINSQNEKYAQSVATTTILLEFKRLKCDIEMRSFFNDFIKQSGEHIKLDYQVF